MKIQSDLKKMNEDGRALLSLSNQYLQYISMFKTLINKEDSWSGIDAKATKEDMIQSCKVYDEVGKILKEYANFLLKTSSELSLLISHNRFDE